MVVPADDLVEPIVGFFPHAANYDPSSNNPVGALIHSDLQGRVERARMRPQHQDVPSGKADERSAPSSAHALKWNCLESLGTKGLYMDLPSIDDVRVPPLILSKWNQSEDGGGYCYNYYTPNNYVCGCVATAMAQLMRYHAHPTAGVGTSAFTIKVDGDPQPASLRGGDGAGGPYDWANMVLDPDWSMTNVQRQAIGALTRDAGVSVGMSYWPNYSSASLYDTDKELVDTFGYSNSIWSGYAPSGHNLQALNLMINPNLDAAHPVLLGLSRSGGGHTVACDGYGYNMSTLYHHLNLGWGGASDAWYNLPDVDAGHYTYDTVDTVVYNVFVNGTGEIISGRVTDDSGTSISGAEVTAEGPGGQTYADSSDQKGIYALTKLPSNSEYDISVSKKGYTFDSVTITTGTSSDHSDPGNVWGADFAEMPVPRKVMPWIPLLLLD